MLRLFMLKLVVLRLVVLIRMMSFVFLIILDVLVRMGRWLLCGGVVDGGLLL